MEITKDLRNNKEGLLSYFRSRSNEIMSELALQYSVADYKKRASALNKEIIKSKENLLSILLETAKSEKWTNRELLECILMINNTNDDIMLEASNSVWEYDYRGFVRRV